MIAPLEVVLLQYWLDPDVDGGGLRRQVDVLGARQREPVEVEPDLLARTVNIDLKTKSIRDLE